MLFNPLFSGYQDRHKAPSLPFIHPLSLQTINDQGHQDRHKAPSHPRNHPLSLQDG